jgi:hypothetical protein
MKKNLISYVLVLAIMALAQKSLHSETPSDSVLTPSQEALAPSQEILQRAIQKVALNYTGETEIDATFRRFLEGLSLVIVKDFRHPLTGADKQAITRGFNIIKQQTTVLKNLKAQASAPPTAIAIFTQNLMSIVHQKRDELSKLVPTIINIQPGSVEEQIKKNALEGLAVLHQISNILTTLAK